MGLNEWQHAINYCLDEGVKAINHSAGSNKNAMVSGDNPGPCLMHFAPPRSPQGSPCPPSIQTNTTHIRLRQLELGIRLPIKLGHSQTIITSIHLPIVPSLKLLNLECFVLVVNEAKGRNSMVAYPATKNDFHIVVLKQLKLHIYIVEMSMNDSDY